LRSIRVEFGRQSTRGLQVLDSTKLFLSRTRLDRIDLNYAIVFSFIILAVGCRTPEIGSADSSGSTPPRILRVATSGDYAPFSLWPDVREPVGFSVSVARAYARERGITLEWVRFQWPRLTSDLMAGSFDMALSGITVRPDRSMFGRFSLPLTESGAIVLVPAYSGLESAMDLDRGSIAIAVNAGGHLERVARRLFPAAHIEAVPDNAKVLPRLLQGRVEAIVTDTAEAPHWQRNSVLRLREIGPLTRDLKAAWFPPENELEAQQFNRWLLRAESSGQLDRLRREHGLSRSRTASPRAALLSSLDERLTLMRAVADAKLILGTPIENAERETLVLDAAVRGVRDAAYDAGVDPPEPDSIRRLFRAQIEAAKWIQAEHLRNVTSAASAATVAERSAANEELNEVIRPALIYLGDRISMLIIACSSEPPGDLLSEDVVFALQRHALPEAQLQALYAALSEIILRERKSEPMRPPRPAEIDRVPTE
jgi:cyclohexadienyl dehydratase